MVQSEIPQWKIDEVNALVELFSNAYCFVQPSENEGLSIALLEAMSYGRVIVVSDIPENVEAANGCGLIFENKNVKDLADKLQYLINNPQLIQAMGDSGKEVVDREYNWDSIADEILKVYKAAIRKKEFGFGGKIGLARKQAS